MPSISLAALLDARPSAPFWGRAWVDELFARQLAADDEHVRLLGWSVGTVIGPESLVQSRPMIRGPDVEPVTDLLRTPAPCTIAVLVRGTDDETAQTRELIGVGRYRRWVSVQAAAPFSIELRRELRDALPDFLARDSRRHSDPQLVLLSLLAEVHASGHLGQSLAPPDAIRQAVGALRKRLAGIEIELFVTDGRTLGVLHGDGTLLAFEPPPDVRPARRMRVADDGTETVPASLLFWSGEPPPAEPVAGAERIAPGVISVQGVRPNQLVRE